MRVYIYLSQKAPEIITGFGKDFYFSSKVIQYSSMILFFVSFYYLSIVSRLETGRNRWL